MRRPLAAVLCTLALGAGPGCVYWPHVQRRSPELRGVLTRDGAPVADVPVRLKVNPPVDQVGRCTGDARTRTDAEGRFVVPRSAAWEYFIVFGDRPDVWRLCFELADDERVTWAGSGSSGGPEVQRLECELGAARAGTVHALPIPPDAQGQGCKELPEQQDKAEPPAAPGDG